MNVRHPLERFRRSTLLPTAFLCNICGAPCVATRGKIRRESVSCRWCGSTVRFRSIIDALSTRMYGKSLSLSQIGKMPPKKGLGLSDWTGYAERLANLTDYRNTFFDREPRLDIADLSSFPKSDLGTFDFLISSDVFEHVAPPVSRAFENSFALLKPGGILVLTVPFQLGDHAHEHYPDLHDWKLERRGNEFVLLNKTTSGSEQSFSNLVFHGGEGSTLEMRVFTLRSLLHELESAGFTQIQLHTGPNPRRGIRFPSGLSYPITASRPAFA